MTKEEIVLAQQEIRNCINEGFLWLDKETNEVCEEEPEHTNKSFLPDFILQ